MEKKSQSAEQLLAEVEDLLRTMPSAVALKDNTAESFGWLGRTGAVIGAWDSAQYLIFRFALNDFHEQFGQSSISKGFRQIMILLHEAQHDLRMRTIGPVNLAIGQGRVFEYFDELRKILGLASQDVFSSIHI